MFKTDKEIIALGFGAIIAIMAGTKIGQIDNDTSLGLIALTGVLLAVRKYYYEKERDQKNEVIDLISFFRKEVIGNHTNFSDLVRKELKSDNHQFIKIHLQEVSMDWLRKNKSHDAKKQAKYIFHNFRTQNQAVDTLNSLEEFSAKVKILNAVNSRELEILYASFTSIIEDLAVVVVHQRDLGPGDTMFRNSIELYNVWSKNVDRETYEEKKAKLLSN